MSALRLARAPLIRAVGALVLASAPPLSAQSGAVLLRIGPRVGDTLYTRLEQSIEMTATARQRGADTSMTVRTEMLLLSRILVQGRDDDGTTVIAVTDSVAIVATGGRATKPPESYRRQLQGQRIRMRISPQGSATLVDHDSELNPDLQAVISQMPATLPDRAIAIGESWTQAMSIPVGGQRLPRGGATLQAVYRLDSLSAAGSVAHISVRGTLSHDSAQVDRARGVRLSATGSIHGTMLVDRRRGWWTDTHATITVTSTYAPLAGSAAPPTRVLTTITQRMRTTGSR